MAVGRSPAAAAAAVAAEAAGGNHHCTLLSCGPFLFQTFVLASSASMPDRALLMGPYPGFMFHGESSNNVTSTARFSLTRKLVIQRQNVTIKSVSDRRFEAVHIL